MRILGLSGGTVPTWQPDVSRVDERVPAPRAVFHDSAAVLLEDGELTAAVEEERLNRIKHTNRLASHAVDACLKAAGCAIGDVDVIAYNGSQRLWDIIVGAHMLSHPHVPLRTNAGEYLAGALGDDLGVCVDAARITFVEHHLAHAASAYDVGPYREALVVTLDGQGDFLSGSVWAGRDGALERLLDIDQDNSLGHLYYDGITYLGYGLFDEYKVMGLASYGDPGKYQAIFDEICVLKPEGKFEIRSSELPRVLDVLSAPRRAGEPITPVHADVAAGLQGALERATLHLLTHYRAATGLRHLCIAGGVAHNSTMIGRIIRAKVFDGVFVQPASHDAGCALGAALVAHKAQAPLMPVRPLQHLYLGADLGNDAEVERQLARWARFIDVTPVDPAFHDVARLLAGGAIVGWMQGRSEFGPRALGNRSILADPRAAETKQRVNELVKNREDYRPFAPVVLDEYADRYFDVPEGIAAGYMTFTVPVHRECQAVLRAVTHVDGTARVQVVSRETNERLWRLLHAFRRLTGIPVLLNTSFNHSVEPIVDSVDDGVTCFLRTGLTHLVAGTYLATKRPWSADDLLHLYPALSTHARLRRTTSVDARGELAEMWRCEHIEIDGLSETITPCGYELARRCDGRRTLQELIDATASQRSAAALLDEIGRLWDARLIRMSPHAKA